MDIPPGLSPAEEMKSALRLALEEAGLVPQVISANSEDDIRVQVGGQDVYICPSGGRAWTVALGSGPGALQVHDGLSAEAMALLLAEHFRARQAG